MNAAKANPRSKKIQPGLYKLHQQMKAALATDRPAARPGRAGLVNKVDHHPRGPDLHEIFDMLAKATNLPVDDFEAAAKDPVALGVPACWFNRQDGKTGHRSRIEGFLYPATYEFDPGADAKTILKRMVQQFLTVTQATWSSSTRCRRSCNISPYEALIAASIAQVEAVFPADMAEGRPGALQPRLQKFACNCLRLDSTVNYWLRVTGKER